MTETRQSGICILRTANTDHANTMPLPINHPPAVDTLKTLIADSDYHLTEIAERSGVPYQTLWKWYKGKQKSIGFLQAEQVYYAITGRTFLSC